MGQPHLALPAAFVLLLLPIRPATAFDPHQVDVLTLRLGMTEAQATERLLAQGIPIQAIDGQRHPCPDSPRGTCLTTVTAPTKDGRLVLHFRPDGHGTASHTVDSIIYTLRFHSFGEPAMIRTSVLGRYGPPNVLDPLTWCAQVGRNGTCPADQPRLTFQPGSTPDNAGTLTLADP
ncbi:MAG: hypothetical protein P4L71_11085 [Acetobacteraceae bacterium]|nr:hypothetical protein [Acetobacteraceae bacterium]